MLVPLVFTNLVLLVLSKDILAEFVVTSLLADTVVWKSLIVLAVCVPVCELLALRLASVSLAVAFVAIVHSLALSVAVNILLVVHSAIFVILKASHHTSFGSYTLANISQLPAQSNHFSAIKFQYVSLVGIFHKVSAKHT